MPFAAVNTPSLGLTRLRSVLQDELGDQASVEIHYLNLEVAQALGPGLYAEIAESVMAHNNGLGEWFFRRSAFPDLPDNTDSYFGRYYPRNDPETQAFRQAILKGRDDAEAALPSLITDRRLHEAQLVGMTSLFLQNNASFALARLLKERNPVLFTALGGANCETPMGEEIARNVPWLDFVFSGPALVTLPVLVAHLLQGETRSCQSVPGVFTQENVQDGKTPGPVGEELHIDTEISLDYSSWLEALEKSFPGDEIQPRLLFETSRGCWWGERLQCTFCGLNGTDMPHRGMSPERARRELNQLFRYYPRCRYFEAVDNLLPRDYVQELFSSFKAPSDATIFYEVKANLSEEELEVLSRAGVRRMQAGIEALSSETLKLIRKGTSSFQNINFLKGCLIHNIDAVWNLLVGFPGEKEETFQKYASDLPLLFHLQPPTGVYPVRMDRYSPYFVDPGSFGLDLDPYDFYRMVYPFPKTSLQNLAYHFVDRNSGADHFEAMVRWINGLRGLVDNWQERWCAAPKGSPPRLCFVEGDTRQRVYDSRGKVPLVHELSVNGPLVLQELERPRRIDVVGDRLQSVPGLDAQAEVEALWRLGLVFRDGNQYLGLVMPEQALATSAPELRPLSRRRRQVSRSSLREDGKG